MSKWLLSFATITCLAATASADSNVVAAKAAKFSASAAAIAAAGPHAAMGARSAGLDAMQMSVQPARSTAFLAEAPISAATAGPLGPSSSVPTPGIQEGKASRESPARDLALASAQLSPPFGRARMAAFDSGGAERVSAARMTEPNAAIAAADVSHDLRAGGAPVVRLVATVEAALQAPQQLTARAPSSEIEPVAALVSTPIHTPSGTGIAAASSGHGVGSSGIAANHDVSSVRWLSTSPLHEQVRANESRSAPAPSVEAIVGKAVSPTGAPAPDADPVSKLAAERGNVSASDSDRRVAALEAPISNASAAAVVASGIASSPSLGHGRAAEAPASGLRRAGFNGKQTQRRRPVGY